MPEEMLRERRGVTNDNGGGMQDTGCRMRDVGYESEVERKE
jgi:hypothetical protein